MEFKKYEQRGKGYHWAQISKRPRQRNAYVLGRYQNMIDLLKSSNRAKKVSTVLDLGCGDGVLSWFAMKEGFNVTGIDYSDLAIEFAKEQLDNKGITFDVGSAYDLPYSENQFDCVISSEVIEHLEDVDKYLSEIKRVVKPNGIIIISTPIKITKEPLDPNHVIEWFQEEFQELIDSKFNKVKYEKSHPIYLQQLNLQPFLGRAIPKLIINLLSLFKNPFRGVSKQNDISTIQYAIITNN